jgi:hypothetical protein
VEMRIVKSVSGGGLITQSKFNSTRTFLRTLSVQIF